MGDKPTTSKLIEALIDVTSEYFVSKEMTYDDARCQFAQILEEEIGLPLRGACLKILEGKTTNNEATFREGLQAIDAILAEMKGKEVE